MAIAQVGNWVSIQIINGTGGTTAGRTSTAGNFVAITASSSTNTSNSITHSQAGTVQTARAFENNTSDFISTRYIENIVGGAAHTITISTASATYSTLNATEYSGVATSSSLDKTNVGTGNSTSLLSAATATTAQADELLIGNGTISAGTHSAWTAGTSYTLRGNINDASLGGTSFLEDQIVAATGTYTASATWTGSAGVWICTVCTFKAVGGAAPPAYPVGPAQRQRRTLPKPRTRWVRPVPPQVNPPIPLASIHPTRQLRGLPVRRGRAVTPVRPQVNPPIVPPRPTQHRTWATLLRRGHHIQPVPPQFNPIIAPPVANQARRLRGWPVRRGRMASPIPTQQTLPTNPAYATVGIQHRLWTGWLRRGRQSAPLPTQTAPPPSPATSRRRPSVAVVRRGRRSGPVGYQDTPQPVQSHRGPRFWRPSARRPRIVPAPTVVVPNPVLPTKTATFRRLAGWMLRRGRKAEQGWPQGLVVTDPYLLENFTTIFSTNDTVLTLSDSGATKVSYTDPTTLTVLDQTAEYDHVDDQGGTKD